VELRHLRYFVAVAEELHFRHAAERLHVAQPAVSEQVRKLEAELGVQLFDRTQRGVSLTGAGQAMLEEARRVIRQADIALHAARAGEHEIGRLRVGCLIDSQPAALQVAVSRFKRSAPGFELALQIGNARQLVDDVRRGMLDVAVVCLPAPVAGLRVTSLGMEGATAAVSEGVSRHGDGALTPESIGDIPLILLPRVVNPAFYDGVIAAWRTAGVPARPMDTSEARVEHALFSVAAGAGIAMLPESVTSRQALTGVRFAPLTPTPVCEVAAISRDEASAPVAAFVRLLRHAARPADGQPVATLALGA
jgi:DNA-binding transcriptional LysR family regulator